MAKRRMMVNEAIEMIDGLIESLETVRMELEGYVDNLEREQIQADKKEAKAKGGQDHAEESHK